MTPPPEAALSLAFSPCPNDTFIFHALVSGRVDAGVELEARLEDVETLNRLALAGEVDVSKVSYGALPHLLEQYVLLRSGGALGRGCGPLLVAREPLDRDALRSGTIAIPGSHTTANLLLRLFDPELPAGVETVYGEIMPLVASGAATAGLIIHESRFTYSRHGLVRLMDLGEWWEGATGHPIPLGGIVARRSLGSETIRGLEAAIRASVRHALANPDDSNAYVSRHAREMEEPVRRSHIELYVNEFSVDLGESGETAVRELLHRAADAGLTPAAADPFAP